MAWGTMIRQCEIGEGKCVRREHTRREAGSKG